MLEPDTMAPDAPRSLAWDTHAVPARRLLLADMLARVSHHAMRVDGVRPMLQRIVDCLREGLPLARLQIALLDDQGSGFVAVVGSPQEAPTTMLPAERAAHPGLTRQPGATDTAAPATIVLAGDPARGDDPAIDVPRIGMRAGDASLPDVDTLLVSAGWGRDEAAHCLRSGQPVWVDAVCLHCDDVPGGRRLPARCMLPIQQQARPLGLLLLASHEPGFFSPDVRAMLQTVAEQIAAAVHLARLVAELEASNRRLQNMLLVDGLTGITNRRGFDLALAQQWRALLGSGQPLALLMVDADWFKLLNDVLGHQHGDSCLRELARICQRFAKRSDDVVARYGGEEITLLLPGLDVQQAKALAEQLRAQVEAAGMMHPDSPVSDAVTVSIGVCVMYPEADGMPEELVAGADRALYAAKSAGRNRVAVGNAGH